VSAGAPAATDDAKPDGDSSQSDAAKNNAADANGVVSRQKVIQPPESEPKKDIKQLLAEEEAKESQTVPGATVIGAPGDEDSPAGAPAPSPSEAAAAEEKSAEGDPGSIA